MFSVIYTVLSLIIKVTLIADTYFFCGPRFWRFDNERVEAHAYYPLPTAQIWFPCDSTPEMNKYLTNDES